MLSWLFGECDPPKSPVLAAAERSFTSAELDELQRQWRKLEAGVSGDAGVPPAVVLGWLGLHHLGGGGGGAGGWLAGRLVHVMAQGRPVVKLDDFVVAKARCLKQGDDEGRRFVFELLDSRGAGALTQDDLAHGVEGAAYLAGLRPPPLATAQPSPQLPPTPTHPTAAAAAAAAVAVEGKATVAGSGEEAPGPMVEVREAGSSGAGGAGAVGSASEAEMEAVVQGAMSFSGREDSGGGDLDMDGFSKWTRTAPCITAALRSLLVQGTEASLPESVWGGITRGPPLAAPLQGRHVRLLLTPFWAWLLASGMSPSERSGWQLLFNSDLHGKSYSTLIARVADRGSTITLVRDAAGALFGGFASDPWQKHGTFYGTFRSNVFSLLPASAVHRPTGANSNFIWCGVGFTSLPNGLGFGGQEGYYGLFIDSSMDTGMSRPTATYGNPCLASSPVFTPDSIEVWLVEPVATSDDEDDAAQRAAAAGGKKVPGGNTVLERFKEEHNIMNIAGVGTNHSDAYRRAEPIEED